jgi:cytochrome c553
MNHNGPPGRPSQLRRKGAVRTLLALLLVATTGVSFADEATSTERIQPDTMEARVAACTHCHGSQGRAGPDGFYPRLAGKPGGYLLAQLRNFRDGRRSYEPMRHLLQGLPDEYLGEMAQYFADMRLPYAAPARPSASAALLERGRTLAELGDPARQLPACISCHGASYSGMEPGIPGLLGLPGDYVVSQLGSWRAGLRDAAPPDCMAQVAQQLTSEDIAAVSAWLASQPVPEPYTAAPAGTWSLPSACGSDASSAGSTR